MTGFGFLVVLVVRYLLVMLFFPFSALDKIVNFGGAVKQAQEALSNHTLATLMLMTGLAVEILMPLGILTGFCDRLAAFIMAGYCMVTAILFKQFWAPGDFWSNGEGKGRGLFWDFLKNFSLGGGFLLITFGTMSFSSFVADPFSSTHPYSAASYVAAAPASPTR